MSVRNGKFGTDRRRPKEVLKESLTEEWLEISDIMTNISVEFVPKIQQIHRLISQTHREEDLATLAVREEVHRFAARHELL